MSVILILNKRSRLIVNKIYLKEIDRYTMSKKRPLKYKLLKKTSDFLKHSTIHGLHYFYVSANKWVNLFWLLTIASSIGLCGFLGHMIWNKFIIDPTFTVVSIYQFSYLFPLFIYIFTSFNLIHIMFTFS